MQELNSAQLKDKIDDENVYILDCREQFERDEGYIPNSHHIPMNEVPGSIDDIKDKKEIIVTCRSGARSAQVCGWLAGEGLENCFNHIGGITDWMNNGFEIKK